MVEENLDIIWRYRGNLYIKGNNNAVRDSELRSSGAVEIVSVKKAKTFGGIEKSSYLCSVRLKIVSRQ